MDLVTAGLHQDTFRLHGEPHAFVQGRSQDAALDFLNGIYSGNHRLGVLEGPRLVGKTTVIQRFVQSLPQPAAAAIVDCRILDCPGFLATILEQFGFHIDQLTVSEQLELLNVFIIRQAAVFHAPLIIIENAHAIHSAISHKLSQLMRARYRGQNALRVVLVSDRPLDAVIDKLGMRDFARRKSDVFLLGPMTATETEHYLYTKLRDGGRDRPAAVAAESLFGEIFEKSGGIPGLVDRQMLLRLNATDELPLSGKNFTNIASNPMSLLPIEDLVPTPGANADVADAPKLFISLNGKMLRTVPLNRSRFLIGRSDINDITIGSQLISRHHALLIQQNGATYILDLNSTNGVIVNSKRVVSQELRHDDIIILGSHVIKVFEPRSRHRGKRDVSTLHETMRMKVLDDLRHPRAKQNTHAVKPATQR